MFPSYQYKDIAIYSSPQIDGERLFFVPAEDTDDVRRDGRLGVERYQIGWVDVRVDDFTEWASGREKWDLDWNLPRGLDAKTVRTIKQAVKDYEADVFYKESYDW